MSFSYFKSKVEALGTVNNGREVILNQAMTGSAMLTALFQTVFEADAITLKCQMLAIETDYIRFTGYIDLLNQENLEFDLRVRNYEDDFSITMALLIPTGWSFLSSWPDMPLANDASDADVQPPTLMDSFRLSTAYIIFSNYSGYDDDFELECVAGLNFKGQVDLFKGNMAMLADLAGISGAVQMTGPIDEYQDVPNPLVFTGIRLSTDIAIAVDFGGLSVTKAQLMLKSPLREFDADLQTSAWADPGIYLVVDMVLDGRPLRVMADYDPIYSDTLRFVGYFTDFAIGGLQVLDTSVGGAGLDNASPSEIGTPTGIHVTTFGFEIDLASKSLTQVTVGIGCGNTWILVPDWLSLRQLGLRFTVDSPFSSANRSFGVGVSGIFDIADVGLQFSVDYPSLDFRVRKDPNDDLSLGAIVRALAPGLGNVPEIQVESLNLAGSASRKQLSLSGFTTALGSIKLGQASLSIDALAYYIDYTKGGNQKGALQAKMSFGDAVCDISAAVASETTFYGNFANLSLRQVYMDVTGLTTFPDELPDVILDSLNIIYNQTTGAVYLYAMATIGYDKLPFGGAIETKLELKISREMELGKPKDYEILLSLKGTGPVTFADGFSLNDFTLNFTYNTLNGWGLGGTFNTLLCNKAIALTASYLSTPNGKKIAFQSIMTPELEIFDYSSYIAFYIGRIDLGVETIAVEGGADKRAWTLRMDSTITIPSVMSIASSIELFTDGDGKKGLKIKPKSLDSYGFTIADGVGVGIKPMELDLLKDGTSSTWKMVGICELSITGVPGKLGAQLPPSFLTTFTLSRNLAKVEMLNPFKPYAFKLPAADGQDLGTMVLEIRTISVSLRPSISFSAQLGLGFPKELNTYFKRQVFREYEADNPMSMALLRCNVSKSGIGLQFLTSPFLAGSNKAVSGVNWMHFDFGDNGEIALQIPNFKYNVTSSYFEASGGFKIVRPLSLPLTPLRNFLDAVGMGAAKAIFPEKLPIKGIALVDANNNFKTEDFITMLGNIPGEIKTTLRGAGDLLNRFPDDFKSYLKFEIPSQLEFKFGFSPAGRVALGLSAPVEPIRFLYPGMVQGLVPMPGLIGIELRKLSVGTLASGSLFFGEIDAIVDMYDLPSLVTSLALPSDPGFPLPTSDQLRRRILLRNVFSIIPLSQGVPVPVPVFYDELGFEYKGLEGIGLQAHMGIPQPDFAAGGTALLQTLATFFKDRSSRLDPKTPPGGQQITFRFHDEYLEAPEYLGGGKVGTSGQVIEIGTWKYVAQLMNFCKRFALEDFIGAIPTANRMANKTVKFACFEVDGQYLITTPEEFDGGAYTALNLTTAQQQDFHDVLPGVQTNTVGAGNGKSGLVMFLRGGVKASTVFDLQASFGLAASGTMGFNTGFKFVGKLGGVVEAELKGALLLNAKDLQDAVTYPKPAPVVQAAVTPAPLLFGQGKSLQFNGVNTYIEIPYSKDLTMTEWSIEFWCKVEAPKGDWICIFGRPGRNYAIYLYKSGLVRCHVHTPRGTADDGCESAVGSFAFNQWQHIAFTFDGIYFRIHLNGIEVGANAKPNTMIIDVNSIFVGRDIDGGNIAYVKGSIADLRIWKRPRMAAEIAADYKTRLIGNEPSLVAYYPLDTDAGPLAADLCGLNHGKIYNGSYASSSLMVPGLLSLNGVQDNIIIPAIDGFKFGAYTIQIVAWIDGDADDISNQLLIASANGNVKIHAGMTKVIAATTIGVPRRRLVTITEVSSATQRLTYVEGELYKTSNGTYSTTASTVKFYIGKGNTNATETVALKGGVAELRIWSDAKSGDWIKANLMTSFTGTEATMLAMYKFAKVKDARILTERGNFPADVNQAAPRMATRATPTPLGLHFGAATQYAVVPANPAFSFTAYTIEFWFRPEQKLTRTQFPLRFPMGSPRIAYINGVLSHRWSDQAGATISLDAPAASVQLGRWTHVTVVHTGTVGRMYIDGKRVGEISGKQIASTASELTLARQSSTDSINNFLGDVDDVRIWSIARDEADIVANFGKPLLGTETGLLARYNLDPADGNSMKDSGPKGLHGTIYGLNLPKIETPPAETGRSLVQAYGHAHLKIGGQEVIVADMRVSGGEFWFKGKINLFPADWPVKVYGDAEGLIGKDKLYLASSSIVQLCGLTLSKSRTLITHEQVRLEGEWLGVYTLIDIQWAGSNPRFKGALEAQYDAAFDFGGIYIKGVRVCDNYHLDMSVGFKIALDFDRNGFAATVAATFKINGVGFNTSLTLKVAPADLDAIGRILRDEIANNAEKYFAFLFKDVTAWAIAAYNHTIEFILDASQTIGRGFKLAWGKTQAEAAVIWKAIGGTASETAAFLTDGYQASIAGIASALNAAGHTLEEMGAALQSLGHSMEDIGSTLYKLGGRTATELAYALRNIGYQISDVAKAIAAALPNDFQGILNALDEPFSDLACVKVLKAEFGKGIKEIAGWQKGLAYDINVSWDTLKDGFAYEERVVGAALKAVGYTCRQISGTLNRFMSGEYAAALLRDIGFNKDEVKDALVTVYKMSSSSVDSLLDRIGGWGKAVSDWLGNL